MRVQDVVDVIAVFGHSEVAHCLIGIIVMAVCVLLRAAAGFEEAASTMVDHIAAEEFRPNAALRLEELPDIVDV